MTVELTNKLSMVALKSRVVTLETLLRIIKGHCESETMNDDEKLNAVKDIIDIWGGPPAIK